MSKSEFGAAVGLVFSRQAANTVYTALNQLAVQTLPVGMSNVIIPAGVTQNITVDVAAGSYGDGLITVANNSDFQSVVAKLAIPAKSFYNLATNSTNSWLKYVVLQTSPYFIDTVNTAPQLVFSTTEPLTSKLTTTSLGTFISQVTGGVNEYKISIGSAQRFIASDITSHQNGLWIALKQLNNQATNGANLNIRPVGGSEALIYQPTIIERDCFITKGCLVPRLINGRRNEVLFGTNIVMNKFYFVVSFTKDTTANYGRIIEIGDVNNPNYNRQNKIAFLYNNSNSQVYASYWGTNFGQVAFNPGLSPHGTGQIQVLGGYFDGATLRLRSNFGVTKNGYTGQTSFNNFTPGNITANAVSFGVDMLSPTIDALNGGICDAILEYNGATSLNDFNSICDWLAAKRCI